MNNEILMAVGNNIGITVGSKNDQYGIWLIENRIGSLITVIKRKQVSLDKKQHWNVKLNNERLQLKKK